VVVEADADELEPLGMIFFVSGDHVIRLSHARAAPGRPEIDDDNFPVVVLELQRRVCATEGFELELWFVTDIDVGRSDGAGKENDAGYSEMANHLDPACLGCSVGIVPPMKR